MSFSAFGIASIGKKYEMYANSALMSSVLLSFYSNTSRPTKNKNASKNTVNTAPESGVDPVRHVQGSGSSLVRLFDPHVYKNFAHSF